MPLMVLLTSYEGRVTGPPPSDAGNSEIAAFSFTVPRAPSTVGASSRRFRGWQPDEVNKSRAKSGSEKTQATTKDTAIPEHPMKDEALTNIETSNNVQTVATAQPSEPKTTTNNQETADLKTASASGAKTNQSPLDTVVPEDAHLVNRQKDSSRDPVVNEAVLNAPKSEHGSENAVDADETSPSIPSSVEAVVDDEPQTSFKTSPLPLVKASASNAVIPNGTWDCTTHEIEGPSGLKANVPRPCIIDDIVKVDLRKLPPYKPPFKSDMSLTKKSRAPASSSFDRQFANITRKGGQVMPVSADGPSSLDHQGPKATAEAADPNKQDSPPQPYPNSTTTENSDNLPPHLRAQVSSSKAAEAEGNQVSSSKAAVAESNQEMAESAKKLPPHLRSLTKKAQVDQHVEVPQKPTLSSENPKGVINIDEELTAGQAFVDTENDAEIAAAAVAAGKKVVASSSTPEIVITKCPGLHSEMKSVEGEEPSKATPPHLRRTKVNTNEANDKPEAHSTLEIQSAVDGKKDQSTTVVHNTGALKDVTASQQDIKMISRQDDSLNTESNKSAVGKGKQPMQKLDPKRESKFAVVKKMTWDNPAEEMSTDKPPMQKFDPTTHESGLVGWDGKMMPPRLDDEERFASDPKREEKFAVIKTWTEDNAVEMEAGWVGNDEHTMKPEESAHPETIPHPDEFNQAKREFTAVHAIEEYERRQRYATGSSSLSPSGKLSKEQRRNRRRQRSEQVKSEEVYINRHAPKANIYLRPAEMGDMGQVKEIHNYYVNNSACANEIDENNEIYWRSRFQETHDEHDPFLVAVLRSQMPTNEKKEGRRRKEKKGDNIVGFAFAADYGIQSTAYRYTVELELWVHHAYHHQGIGRTMLDRMLGAMDPGYNLLECVPMRNCDSTLWSAGGRAIIKTILVNLLHCEVNAASLDWKKKWLAENNFEDQGTLKSIGFKHGRT